MRIAITARSAIGVLLCAAVLSLTACGKSPDELLSDAKAVNEKGDRGAAILQVKSLLQEHPEHTPSRLLLGLLYNDAADYAGAEKELRRAMDGQADPAQVLPALAKALLMQGEAKKVLTEIQPDKVSDRNAVTKILAARGMAHLALHQNDDARKAFDDALTAKPDAPEALVGRARILASERKLEDALAEVGTATQSHPRDADALMLQGDLLRALGKTDEAEQSYKNLVAAHPEHVTGLLALISMSVAKNRLDDAAGYVATVRKASPRNPMVSYFQALIAFRKNDFKAARDSIGAVLKVAPNHLPSVLLGGAVEFALGSNELAQTRLKYVLERAPGNLYARRVLAASYTRAGQTQKALETLEPALKMGTKDPAMLALAGEVHMQLNDFDRAKSYFEQASALDPKNARMRTGLGLSRLASGDVEAATADLENAAQLDTTRNQADVLLVSTYLQRKQFDQALKAAESLVAKQPKSPVGHNLMAAAYLGKKDEEAARQALLKALEVQQNYVPAAANLAQLDVRKGDKKAARKRFEDILAKDNQNVQAYLTLAKFGSQLDATKEDVRKWLEAARSADPTAIQPLALLIQHLMSDGQSGKALEVLDKALTTSPERAELLELAGKTQLAVQERNRALSTFVKLTTSYPSASSFHLLAVAQVANNDIAAGINSLKKALTYRPQFPEAQILLTELETRAGHSADALKVAADMQLQNSKSPIGWVAEGDVHMSTKNFGRAVSAYERAYALQPLGSTLIRTHAALAASGRGDDGERRLTDWVKKNPTDLTTRMHLAEAYLKAGKFPQAIDQYEGLVKANSANLIAWNNLAWCYQQVKDKRAVEAAEKALALKTDSPEAMDTLGWILVQAGEVSRGIEFLKKAAAAAPKSPEIRYHYAQAVAKNGDKTHAKELLERLLLDFPRFSESKGVMSLLAALRSSS